MNRSETPPVLRIALGVTGSIAAYKAPFILRRLQERGASVRVAMTPAATRFIGALTFEALSGAPVYLDQCAIDRSSDDIAHTDISAAIDALVVAPASADIIAKIAYGLADDPVSLLALALRPGAPLVVAPAMNPRMWAAASVQENVATLRRRGAVVIGPAEGETACGDEGVGRMSEPEEIAASVLRAIARSIRSQPPRRLLVLNGPTREHLDDVRFISNGSSGRMGVALAEAAWEAGDDVAVVSGPSAIMPPPWIPCRCVTSADEMLAAAREIECDVIAAPAAVADFAPAERRSGKPRKGEITSLAIRPTPDVLAGLRGRAGTVLAFSAEESLEATEEVRAKARAKGATHVALNRAIDVMGAGTAELLLIELNSDRVSRIGPAPKTEAGRALWRALFA